MENLTLIKMNTVKIDATFVGNLFTVTFREGVAKGEKFVRENSAIHATNEYNVTELPESLFVDCPFSRHGLKQKMIDNLAMSADIKAATSVKEAMDSTDVLWKQLKDGNFNSPTKASKAPSIKLTDMEAKFMAGVIAGVTTWEAANDLYGMVTGKTLPKLPETDETTEA